MTENVTVEKVINQVQVASDGPQGPTGPTGATGAQGPSGVLSVTAPITNSGTSTSAVIGINAGVANGVATLDSDGKIPQSQIPAVAITNTFVVASQAAMLALTAQEGDVAVRTDLNKTYILTATPSSTLANWQELLTPTDAVQSVDGRTGTVTLNDLYAAKTHASTHASGGTDAVTLAQSQVTNLTTDLAAKAPLASPTFTGTLTTPNAIVTGSTVPANGIYLPATNTLGLSTNSSVRAVINSSGLFGIATTSPAASFHLVSSTNPAVFVDQYGNDATGANIVGRKSRGSVGSPSAVLNGDFVVALIARGYGTTAFGTNNIGLAGFQAAEDFTDSAQGVHYIIGTTPTGSGGRVERFRILASGSVAIGSTSGTLGSGSVAQQLGIVSAAATTVGVVVRGASGQTANLQEWQNSGGTASTYITPSGSIFIGTGGTRIGAVNGDLLAVAYSAVVTPIVVKGFASQTANLQQWQNSAATVIASVDSSGNIRGTSVRTLNDFTSLLEANSGGYVRITKQTAATPNPGSGLGSLYFRDGTNAGTLKLVVRAGASGAETTILDNIPQ